MTQWTDYQEARSLNLRDATNMAIVKASSTVDDIVTTVKGARHTLVLCPRMDGGLDQWWVNTAPQPFAVTMMFSPDSTEAEVLAEIARFSRTV